MTSDFCAFIFVKFVKTFRSIAVSHVKDEYGSHAHRHKDIDTPGNTSAESHGFESPNCTLLTFGRTY